jgi:hypothetical protein
MEAIDKRNKSGIRLQSQSRTEVWLRQMHRDDWILDRWRDIREVGIFFYVESLNT